MQMPTISILLISQMTIWLKDGIFLDIMYVINHLTCDREHEGFFRDMRTQCLENYIATLIYPFGLCCVTCKYFLTQIRTSFCEKHISGIRAISVDILYE